MFSLLSMLEQDKEMENWRQYMATVDWSIGRYVHRGDYLPMYQQMFENSKPDDRSADEVVDDLAEKIRNRLRERSEKA